MDKKIKKVIDINNDPKIRQKIIYTDNSFTTEDRDGTIRHYNIKSNLDGHPAVSWTNGEFETKMFYKDGVLDNENGPAIYQTSHHPVGYRVHTRYFLNGQEIDFDDHQQFRKSGLSKEEFLNRKILEAATNSFQDKVGICEKIKNMITT